MAGMIMGMGVVGGVGCRGGGGAVWVVSQNVAVWPELLLLSVQSAHITAQSGSGAVREDSNLCTMTNALGNAVVEHHKYNLTGLPTEPT